ncbi:MAG: hypothetical protein M1834_002998 [Cirrosporium novae-zelandiae]|nr:MAG: hypothetical protein M1834_002998 [Cirrosporium novae-zelandiae]
MNRDRHTIHEDQVPSIDEHEAGEIIDRDPHLTYNPPRTPKSPHVISRNLAGLGSGLPLRPNPIDDYAEMGPPKKFEYDFQDFSSSLRMLYQYILTYSSKDSPTPLSHDEKKFLSELLMSSSHTLSKIFHWVKTYSDRISRFYLYYMPAVYDARCMKDWREVERLQAGAIEELPAIDEDSLNLFRPIRSQVQAIQPELRRVLYLVDGIIHEGNEVQPQTSSSNTTNAIRPEQDDTLEASYHEIRKRALEYYGLGEHYKPLRNPPPPKSTSLCLDLGIGFIPKAHAANQQPPIPPTVPRWKLCLDGGFDPMRINIDRGDINGIYPGMLVELELMKRDIDDIIANCENALRLGSGRENLWRLWYKELTT